MHLHTSQHARKHNDVTVLIVANFTPEEQQILHHTNRWYSHCLPKRIAIDRSKVWRDPAKIQPTFSELVPPGFRIDNFTPEYAAKFEQRFRSEIEPQIRGNLFDIVHAY